MGQRGSGKQSAKYLGNMGSCRDASGTREEMLRYLPKYAQERSERGFRRPITRENYEKAKSALQLIRKYYFIAPDNGVLFILYNNEEEPVR